MHLTQWGPERPLPPPVSLASQSHQEKPPEVTCTSRGNPGFPASTRERPGETFFNTSRGQIPLPWLGSNDALPLATRTFVMMYHPTLGVMNYLVSLVGLSPFKWTYSSSTALYAIALVDVWEWTPLIMLIALAGLAALPKEPYESALIDGASPFQCFWLITLPLLRPTLVVAILFRAIDALKTFDIIFVMTQGGPSNASETINILLFNQAFSYFNMGYASSMAVALFAIVMGASLILMKVRRVGW